MSAKNLKNPCYLLTATTTSSSITLSPSDANKSSLDIVNAGSAAVCLTSGFGSATAAFPTVGNPVNGTVILPGAVETLTKSVGDDTIAGIAVSGSNSVYISVGSGE